MIRRLLRGERGWNLADQAVSSLSNVAASFAALRACSAEEFGAHAIGISVYFFSTVLIRAAVGEPVIILRRRRRASEGRALGATLALSLAFSTAIALASVLTSGGLRWALLVVALVLPMVHVQDTCRHILIADHRARSTFVNDCLWLALVGLGIAVAWLVGLDQAYQYIGFWGVGGALAGWFGLRQVGHNPSLRGLRTWFATRRYLAGPFVLEAIVRRGGPQLVTFGLAAVLGLDGLAIYSAALLLTNPLTVITLGMRTWALNEGARLAENAPDRIRPWLLKVGMVLVGAPLLHAGLLAAVPSTWLLLFTGSPYPQLRICAVMVALGTAVMGVVHTNTVGLKIFEAARESLVVQLVQLPILVILVLGGGWFFGPPGASAGSGLAPIAAMVMSTYSVHRLLAVREGQVEVGRAERTPRM